MSQTPPQTTMSSWDEDPDGASILLATGRAHHDLLIVAEPALLTELDHAWGRPKARLRLSFLPGVSAPGTIGQEDALLSYDYEGLGVLLARGRTSLFEGRPARRTTALARIAAGTGVRAAILLTRATSLGSARLGDFLTVSDHLSFIGSPLFVSDRVTDCPVWDEEIASQVSSLEGVREPGVVALVPGPLRPSRAEAGVLAALGTDAVVMDSVAEAMALAARGVRVLGLAYVDAVADLSRPSGRRSASPERRHAEDLTSSSQRPAPDVVLAAVESVLGTLLS